MHRLLPALLLTACVAPDDARTAWLVDALVDDNRVWTTRDPELLAAKYRKMAVDPYNFLRATATVWLRDQSRPGVDRPSTRFLRSPEATEILLAGDPHPENLGTFYPGLGTDPEAATRVDLNDLDGAGFGPWTWDLRRAAVGIRMMVAPTEACDAACADAAVDALARGYAEEIAVLADGGAPVEPVEGAGHGAIVDRLIDDSEDDGRRRDREDDETERTEDGLVLLRDDALASDGRGHLALTEPEQRLLDDLMDAYARHPAAPPGFRVRDSVRRYGRGVASLPAVRFVVLYDTGDPGEEDDLLLQVREVVDPPAFPGASLPVTGLFASQADRIEEAPRLLWSRPDTDPRNAGLVAQGLTFKVVAWTDHNQGFEHVDIAEDLDDGVVGPGDVAAFGAMTGRILAGAHGRAPTAGGLPGLRAVAADLDGDADGLAEELRATSRIDLDESLADHARFLDALDRLGPWLGAEVLGPFGDLP